MTRILAIETSCDETAVSILSCEGEPGAISSTVLGTGLYSQVAKHAEYGGVYPNLAKREHEQNLVPLLKKALSDAGLYAQEENDQPVAVALEILSKEHDLQDPFTEFVRTTQHPPIDAIAVTQGPGLEPALWVGLNFAKALSAYWNVPLVPVNHMEGHIFSVLVDAHKDTPLSFPAVALLVSGGHTELILVNDWLSYELIGQTRDDAVGEAFDKVARLLSLPYPGGPEISKLAEEARTRSIESTHRLPRPMLSSDDFDFSYSGLKTAVLYLVREHPPETPEEKMALAREFEDAAIEVLVRKTLRAVEERGARSLIVGGGVIANRYLRTELARTLSESSPDVALFIPTHELSTDNAVMIGIAGYIRIQKNPDMYHVYDPSHDRFDANGTMRLAH